MVTKLLWEYLVVDLISNIWRSSVRAHIHIKGYVKRHQMKKKNKPKYSAYFRVYILVGENYMPKRRLKNILEQHIG